MSSSVVVCSEEEVLHVFESDDATGAPSTSLSAGVV